MTDRLFDLSGKVALVTGASGGLGFGFATGLAKQGAAVVLWARNRARNEAAAEKLAALGVQTFADTVDVADEAQVRGGIARAVERFGRIDCAIANAGFSDTGPDSLAIDSARWHALLDINLHGSFYTLREAALHMRARAESGDPGGSLIACGSLSVWRGVPGLPHYAAAKGALFSLVKTMAADLGRFGIRVNMVAPGYVDTGLLDAAADETAAAYDAYFTERTPIPRVGRPGDFEAIAAYLASDAAAFHSGDAIVIDGGYMTRL